MTVIHLFFPFCLFTFLVLNMVNKITDRNPLKSKLGIFIEEQGVTGFESLWKEATDHKSLRTTGLEGYKASVGLSITLKFLPSMSVLLR